MNKKYCFIVNPFSGTDRRNIVAQSIHAFFLKYPDLEYTIQTTTSKQHTIELAKESVPSTYDVIIAVGGDGTVHDVGKRLINTSKTFGIVARGSGNGFARNLGLPMNINRALEKIIQGNTLTIDTVHINDEQFLGIAGMGFDAFIAAEFAKKKKRGLKTYASLVMNDFSNYPISHYKITLNGKVLEQDAFMVSLANSAQFGNNAFIAPYADIQDGLLDICVLKKFPLYMAPVLAVRLFAKTIDRSKYMSIYQASEVEIYNPNTLVHLDGEPYELDHTLKVKVNPQSLRVIGP